MLWALGGSWSLTRVFELLPSRLLEAPYDFVAVRRYRWFGRFDTCMAPQPQHRPEFIDDGGAPGR